MTNSRCSVEGFENVNEGKYILSSVAQSSCIPPRLPESPPTDHTVQMELLIKHLTAVYGCVLRGLESRSGFYGSTACQDKQCRDEERDEDKDCLVHVVLGLNSAQI